MREKDECDYYLKKAQQCLNPYAPNGSVGVFSKFDLVQLGLTDSDIKKMLKYEIITKPRRNVYNYER